VISSRPFEYAGGIESIFRSKRLFRASVKILSEVRCYEECLTQESASCETCKHAFLAHVLYHRYGIEVRRDEINYESLTRFTTGENGASFMEFKSYELDYVIRALEEMPPSLRKSDHLQTLLRRIDGHKHPLCPTAPTVPWITDKYLEFMNSAFMAKNFDYTYGLVLHEKFHFIYDEFDKEMKQKWRDLSNWTEINDTYDMAWHTKDELNFVSAYAHLKNPNEDFAESGRAYIQQPKHLKNVAPGKYAFIKEALGVIYNIVYRKSLTFRVTNPWSDNTPPSAIKKLSVTVHGAPEEDKKINIVITLHNDDYQNQTNVLGKVSLRHATMKDLRPIELEGSLIANETNSALVLRQVVDLSRYVPSGEWVADQIELIDANKNRRYVKKTERIPDFAWKCEVNNTEEQLSPPTLVLSSLNVRVEQREETRVVKVTWKIRDPLAEHITLKEMACQAALKPDDVSQYAKYAAGNATKTPNEHGTYTCTALQEFRNYDRSDTFSVSMILFTNDAHYVARHDFKAGFTRFSVDNGDWSDTMTPRLDGLPVLAVNTSTNTTFVRIDLRICDYGGSALEHITYDLKSPTEKDHFVGNWVKEWPTKCNNVTLEHHFNNLAESGIWKLHNIRLQDKASNVANIPLSDTVQANANVIDSLKVNTHNQV